MLITLSLVLCALVFSAWVVGKFLNFPRNIWVLFLTQPLWMCISPVITFIGGLLASQIAPSASLATLPLALLIIGAASGSMLSAKLANNYGRKKATYIGLSLALLATQLAMFSAIFAHFNLLLLAAFLLGVSLAFSQQLRFAAIESVHAEQAPKVLSTLMLSGIFAAFIGPEIALLGKDWIPSPHGYAGSFMALSVLIIVAAVVFIKFTNPIDHIKNEQHSPSRPLSLIIKQPLFLIALASAAIGYGLMSFLMTATPLSMHDMNGHSLSDTKWVIQSHIAAMFLPSLFTGVLIKRFSAKKVLIVGTILFAAVVAVALRGQQVVHYWWALVLLGMGWNFLFITGTVLLPQSYHQSERFRVQAINDFVIFATQAVASLLAGWLLFNAGWATLVYSTVPFIIVMFGICFYYRPETHRPVNKP